MKTNTESLLSSVSERGLGVVVEKSDYSNRSTHFTVGKNAAVKHIREFLNPHERRREGYLLGFVGSPDSMPEHLAEWERLGYPKHRVIIAEKNAVTYARIREESAAQNRKVLCVLGDVLLTLPILLESINITTLELDGTAGFGQLEVPVGRIVANKVPVKWGAITANMWGGLGYKAHPEVIEICKAESLRTGQPFVKKAGTGEKSCRKYRDAKGNLPTHFQVGDAQAFLRSALFRDKFDTDYYGYRGTGQSVMSTICFKNKFLTVDKRA